MKDKRGLIPFSREEVKVGDSLIIDDILRMRYVSEVKEKGMIIVYDSILGRAVPYYLEALGKVMIDRRTIRQTLKDNLLSLFNLG